jgi:flagella basal body P-ring formation protein FlgA
MKRILHLFLLACVCFALCAGAAVPGEVEVHIELKDDAIAHESVVTFSDVAIVRADKPQAEKTLNALRVRNAPMAGRVEQMTREELEQVLRTRGDVASLRITWSGARAVRIRRAGQTLQGEVLIDTAKAYLQEALASRFDKVELEPVMPLADLEVPAGTVSLQARPFDGKPVVRVPVWVDVYVNGMVVRSAVVALHVKAMKDVLVARRDLPAGSTVFNDDFEAVQQDVAALQSEPIAASGMREPRRLRKALLTGKVLTDEYLLEQGAVSRGDTVTLMFTEGGVVVEVLATAEHEARIGRTIMVRPAGGTDRVEGRLVARGMVEANGTK